MALAALTGFMRARPESRARRASASTAEKQQDRFGPYAPTRRSAQGQNEPKLPDGIMIPVGNRAESLDFFEVNRH